MREEGEAAAAAADEAAAAAYAADGDDDGLGLDRRPLRSFLVVRPAAAADAAADDRLRLGALFRLLLSKLSNKFCTTLLEVLGHFQRYR